MKDLAEFHYFLGVSIKQKLQQVWTYMDWPTCTYSNHICSGYVSAVGNLLYLSGWTRPDIRCEQMSLVFAQDLQRNLDCSDADI